MRRLIIILALLPLLAAQNINTGNSRKLFTPLKPSFVSAVTASTSGSGGATVTSPSITVTSNDLAVGNCSSATNISNYTASNSASDSITTLTSIHTVGGAPNQSVAGFYILHPSAGSLTFTCTQTNTGGTFFAVFVAVFHRGFITAFDTSAQGLDTSASTSHSSPAFSTSAGGLITAFGGGFGAGSGSVTLGNIGSTAMTSMYNDGQNGWGFTIPGSLQTSITAAMTSSSSVRFENVVIAFK